MGSKLFIIASDSSPNRLRGHQWFAICIYITKETAALSYDWLNLRFHEYTLNRLLCISISHLTSRYLEADGSSSRSYLRQRFGAESAGRSWYRFDQSDEFKIIHMGSISYSIWWHFRKSSLYLSCGSSMNQWRNWTLLESDMKEGEFESQDSIPPFYVSFNTIDQTQTKLDSYKMEEKNTLYSVPGVSTRLVD